MENKKLPAFPNLNSDGYATAFELLEDKITGGAIGLTKREYFAAMAMQGILANNTIINAPDENFKERIAKASIGVADELLKQLEQ